MIRSPWEIVAMIVLSVLFGFVSGGGMTSESEGMDVTVYSEDLPETELASMVEELDGEASTLNWRVVAEEEALAQLNGQSIEGIVNLGEDSYELILAREQVMLPALVEPVLERYFIEEELAQLVGDEALAQLHRLQSSFSVEQESMQTESAGGEQGLRSLFGFLLFFAIYTVSFSVSSILEIKYNGIWNRMVLSPTSKVSMYVGYLISSFLLGYAQIVIVLSIFNFLLDVSFYGGFWKALVAVIPFLFAIMAIGVFLSGIVQSQAQLSIAIQLVAISSAMLGGAFWPLEIVGSDLMLALSYASPIMYGMELLMGATAYSWGWEEFLWPAAVLFFIGAAVIGIGLHLMERKATL